MATGLPGAQPERVLVPTSLQMARLPAITRRLGCMRPGFEVGLLRLELLLRANDLVLFICHKGCTQFPKLGV